MPNNYQKPAVVTEILQNVEAEIDTGFMMSRKSKNILNLHDTDINGNYTQKPEIKTETKAEEPVEEKYRIQLAWINILGFAYLHYAFFVGVSQIRLDWLLFYVLFYGVQTGFGITAGAHRLWAHGAYKAKLPLKLYLVYFQTAAFQNSIYEWVRDHRLHHKFTDTNADPHNASRGFFFSHMGWLCCKKHPDVKKYGKKIDMSDMERDPIIMFQHRNYLFLMPFACFIIPTLIPMFFGVPFYKAYYANIFRYLLVLHFTWLVNSYAHIFGNKPYDKFIKPTESYTVSLLAFGEGWHNYHHTFPYDYKTSEHDKYWCNYTTGFLEAMAWIGWATDLKTISPEVIRKRIIRTGDGSHEHAKEYLENNVKQSPVIIDEHIWGWQDEKMTENDKNEVTIYNKT